MSILSLIFLFYSDNNTQLNTINNNEINLLSSSPEQSHSYNTNKIEYYIYYLLSLIIIYIFLVLIFKQLNDNKLKKNKLNESFDFYGANEGLQIIHNELTPEQSSLRRKFLIASTLIKVSIWIKAPYMFALYSRLHQFTRPEIGILYLIENLTSLLIGPLIGSLCDLFGRKKFCVLYAFFMQVNFQEVVVLLVEIWL